ncbi:MAG TPA: hypothetical protein VGQ53_07000, partial [Chitinophagaceae bacterium]|nr:hypothetical protein [Chitinophagaceae bacterium]
MAENIELENPFNITKATDFSNQQIADYWVDFYTSNGEDLKHYLNPSDLTPKYIIGSKGCGKTHLLRYFSFPLQKLRNKDSAKNVIENDKYIGLNVDLGAMNSSRMFGCDISDEQWDAIFGYYLELYTGINFLDVLSDLFVSLKLNISEEIKLVEKIKVSLCYDEMLNSTITIRELRNYINELKKNVDFHINNAALIRKIDFKRLAIKLTPGDIFFKLPEILVNELNELKDLKFIFILDELEKLREYQKIYVNTMVWDKKRPSTFWIGARTFGFTTRNIKSGEVLKNGSEFQEIKLDEIMRDDEDRYQIFATNLMAKRLNNIKGINLNLGDSNLKLQIDIYFEHFNDNIFLNNLRKRRKEFPHERSFKYKLKEGIEKKLIRGIN